MSKKEEFLEKCLIVDTETTTNDYKIAEIIESAYAIRKDGSWDWHSELHGSTDPISPTIQSICYIDNAMVANEPLFVDDDKGFEKNINGDKYLVAHNHFFDMRVLQSHGINTDPARWICTWRMAKIIFNNVDEIESTNLPYLRFALGLDVSIDMHCHRAGHDCLITGKLLEVLIELLEEMGRIDKNEDYGPQIKAILDEPIIYATMPFGKHKGIPMEDVPRSYWDWMLKNTDKFDEDADNYDSDFAESVLRVLD